MDSTIINSTTKLVLSKSQKKKRFDFSVKNLSLDWSKVVFMGTNKLNGVEMWGMISQFDGCAFRAVIRKLKSHQYESFLDEVILPMWKANKNLIFMHDERQARLSGSWRAMHCKIEFLLWPKFMGDLNPFDRIWSNINNRVQDELDDLMELYTSWEDARVTFENFHHMYESMPHNFERIVENCGDFVDK